MGFCVNGIDGGILKDKYDLIEKERLQWLRDDNKRTAANLEEYKRRIRVYKRNEKFQFWGYHDLISAKIEPKPEPIEYNENSISDNKLDRLIDQKDLKQLSRLSRSSLTDTNQKSIFLKRHSYDNILNKH